jgi:hypothetical protein
MNRQLTLNRKLNDDEYQLLIAFRLLSKLDQDLFIQIDGQSEFETAELLARMSDAGRYVIQDVFERINPAPGPDPIILASCN